MATSTKRKGYKMNTNTLTQVKKEATEMVKSGIHACKVSEHICKKYNLNWMFVAPNVKQISNGVAW